MYVFFSWFKSRIYNFSQATHQLGLTWQVSNVFNDTQFHSIQFFNSQLQSFLHTILIVLYKSLSHLFNSDTLESVEFEELADC